MPYDITGYTGERDHDFILHGAVPPITSSAPLHKATTWSHDDMALVGCAKMSCKIFELLKSCCEMPREERKEGGGGGVLQNMEEKPGHWI